MAQWHEHTVPNCRENDCSDEVLVTVEGQGPDGKLYKRRVIKAVYIPHNHCTVEDLGWNMYDGVPNDWEYVEEQDSQWIPEGWYEVCDYFDEYSYATITDKVTAWMKLPKPCVPKVEMWG